MTYTYDGLDRVTAVKLVKGGVTTTLCSYVYDHQGYVNRKILGGDAACTWTYEYDLLGRIGRAFSDKGDERLYTYDVNNNLVSMKTVCGGSARTTQYTYDKDDRETKTVDGTAVLTRTYDAYGWRATCTRGNNAFATTCLYGETADGQPVNRIVGIDNNGSVIRYTHDRNGNLQTVQDDAGTTRYYYDAMSCLVREDHARLGKTIFYVRDAGGNVLQKVEYALTDEEHPSGTSLETTSYVYSTTWKDQLTAVNGQTIRYDAGGSVTAYKGWQYNWSRDGILDSIRKADGTQVAYTVNADGIRTQKCVNGTVVSTYYLDGSRILAEETADGRQDYIYNSSGELSALRYKQNVYYYVRNGQSDIIGLCNASGSMAVTYSYDTWGNPLSIGGSKAATLGEANPFRYRGYYYDQETGLYYLNSRYYDPELGRMLSVDSLSVLGISRESLNDKNLYNYCDGNPVGRTDANGRLWGLTAVEVGKIVVSAAIGGYFALTSTLADAELEGREATAGELIFNTLGGIISGGIGEASGLWGTLWDIGVAGFVGAYTTDGTIRDKFDAAINGMLETALFGVIYGNIKIPIPDLPEAVDNLLVNTMSSVIDYAVAIDNTNTNTNINTSHSFYVPVKASLEERIIWNSTKNPEKQNSGRFQKYSTPAIM